MFAIQLSNKENIEDVIDIAKKLMQVENDVVVFSQLEDKEEKDVELDGLTMHKVPEELRSNNFMAKNYIISKFEEEHEHGFLHIIEDPLKLDKDPSEFISKVQTMMDVLDYSIWFSTTTDGCNFLFNKFNPRLEFMIDDELVAQKLGLSNDLMFTSHANTFWTIYHRRNADEHIQRYSESFFVSMYAIIEYLARRKANRRVGQPYFMNQYLSIKEECGAFSLKKQWHDPHSLDKETMQKEDALFKSMNVNFAPDNNIDVVLETVYQKIQEKLQAINENGKEQKTANTAS